MKNFTITCTIKNELTKLDIMLNQSSITSFNIYKNNKWIATIVRKCNVHYSLTSYSNYPISQLDVDAIGAEIHALEQFNNNNSGANIILNAA